MCSNCSLGRRGADLGHLLDFLCISQHDAADFTWLWHLPMSSWNCCTARLTRSRQTGGLPQPQENHAYASPTAAAPYPSAIPPRQGLGSAPARRSRPGPPPTPRRKPSLIARPGLAARVPAPSHPPEPGAPGALGGVRGRKTLVRPFVRLVFLGQQYKKTSGGLFRHDRERARPVGGIWHPAGRSRCFQG
jgi:hypothetical protein